METATPFSYQCGRCTLCCLHTQIRVNPYEILCLARNRKTNTTEFLRRYTDAGGVLLRRRHDGACIFLTEDGCGVYEDRPLSCRAYPLARNIDAEGVEIYSNAEQDSGSTGQHGREGTIESYLQQQGAVPYLKAADLYLGLFRKMIYILNQGMVTTADEERWDVAGASDAPEALATPEPSWLDIDAVVGWHCSELDIEMPDEPFQLVQLHIELLSNWSKHIITEKSV